MRDRVFLGWLYPLTYLVHILEEDQGRFYEWATLVAERPLGRAEFLALNGIGLALSVAAAVLVSAKSDMAWLLVTLATATLLNAASHGLATLWYGIHSPGLYSALLLWVPLGLVVIARERTRLDEQTLRLAVLSGVIVHLVVIWTAFVRPAG